MFSLITWLWNIRHRKLLEETKQIVELHLFLRRDCSLKCADKLSVKDLKQLLYKLKRDKI